MATVTETDLQQVKDLIISLHGETQKQIFNGSEATQKQIADSNAATQRQITDSNAVMQRQITDSNAAMQKQMTDGYAAMQRQIAELALNTHQQIADLNARLDVGLIEVKGEIKEMKAEIKSVDIRMSDLKNDQRAQDTRFFWLFTFILTTAVGITGKLAKLY
jgi:hypothetical protein